jgi:hypothetical protein
MTGIQVYEGDGVDYKLRERRARRSTALSSIGDAIELSYAVQCYVDDKLHDQWNDRIDWDCFNHACEEIKSGADQLKDLRSQKGIRTKELDERSERLVYGIDEYARILLTMHRNAYEEWSKANYLVRQRLRWIGLLAMLCGVVLSTSIISMDSPPSLMWIGLPVSIALLGGGMVCLLKAPDIKWRIFDADNVVPTSADNPEWRRQWI